MRINARLGFEMEIVLIAMLVWAFTCVFYICIEWRSKSERRSQARCKRAVLVGGPCSITLQALLDVTFVDAACAATRALDVRFAQDSVLPTIPAIASVGFWRARSRWWLLASSFIFLVVSFVSEVGLTAE
jgi:hypothetical protein